MGELFEGRGSEDEKIRPRTLGQGYNVVEPPRKSHSSKVVSKTNEYLEEGDAPDFDELARYQRTNTVSERRLPVYSSTVLRSRTILTGLTVTVRLIIWPTTRERLRGRRQASRLIEADRVHGFLAYDNGPIGWCDAASRYG